MLGLFSWLKMSPENGIIEIDPRISRGLLIREARFFRKCRTLSTI